MKPTRVSQQGKEAIAALRHAMGITPGELAYQLGIPVQKYKELEMPNAQKAWVSPEIIVAIYHIALENLESNHEAVTRFEAQFPLSVLKQKASDLAPRKEDAWIRSIKAKWEKGMALGSVDWLLSAVIMAAKSSVPEVSRELHVPTIKSYNVSHIVNHAHMVLAEPSPYVELLFSRARQHTNGWFDDDKRREFIEQMRDESGKLQRKSAMPYTWKRGPKSASERGDTEPNEPNIILPSYHSQYAEVISRKANTVTFDTLALAIKERFRRAGYVALTLINSDDAQIHYLTETVPPKSKTGIGERRLVELAKLSGECDVANFLTLDEARLLDQFFSNVIRTHEQPLAEMLEQLDTRQITASKVVSQDRAV